VECGGALLRPFLFFGFVRAVWDLECGSALLCRFGLALFVFASARSHRSETGKTKAAEQSTAALQTENRADQTTPRNQSGTAKHRRTPHESPNRPDQGRKS
jgi:hypothetical protein